MRQFRTAVLLVAAVALVACKSNIQLGAEQRIGTRAGLGADPGCSGVQTECQENDGRFVFNYRLDPIGGDRYQLTGLVSQIGNRYTNAPRFEVVFYVINDNTIVDVIVARSTGTISSGLKLSEQIGLAQPPEAIRVANYTGVAYE